MPPEQPTFGPGQTIDARKVSDSPEEESEPVEPAHEESDEFYDATLSGSYQILRAANPPVE